MNKFINNTILYIYSKGGKKLKKQKILFEKNEELSKEVQAKIIEILKEENSENIEIGFEEENIEKETEE